MFGVVPKPLWSRRAPADERNRIELAMRCLLIETSAATVLVDTGLGNKESEKFRDIYAVQNDGRPTRLEDSLRALGVSPASVDIVVNTHLHFDHAGGNVVMTPDGDLTPAFPRARYVIQEGELGFAGSNNPRVRASYMSKNFMPLVEAGLVDLPRGNDSLVEGLRLMLTPGHTPYHQSVVVESQGETAVFLADLCPAAAHLPLPWIMAFDVEPMVTLETKTALWERARNEGWILIFQHDVEEVWGRLDPDEDTPSLVPLSAEG